MAYDDGYSYSETAKILLLDDETIHQHIEDYSSQKKLSPENGDRASKLNFRESKQLIEHLEEVTYLYVKDICAYVKQAYQKRYSISGMTQWLHTHAFSYKNPHAVPAKANAEQQQKLIDYYHDLKAKVGNKEPIYFADSVHSHHQNRLAYDWILQGQRKAIPTTGIQYWLNFMGGICLNSHRFVYKRADQVNADAIASFLSELRKQHPGRHKIHLIWDRAGYHRDRGVQEFSKDLAIKLHYFPPYSPNLNPIERLCEQVTYNRYYGTFAEFYQATIGFL